MEAIIYNTKGKEAGKVSLNDKVWGLRWNADLIHQVVGSIRANARTETARAKDRSEVRGGGKKPWRQKGTGRARHGSSRSPIWRHGGVTHGPRPEKDYSKKVNKKMAAKALYVVLSEKLRKNEIMFVDEISFAQPKTRDAKVVLGALAGVKGFEKILTKKRNSAYLTTSEKAPVVAKSFANLGNIDVDMVQNMNIIDLLSHKFAVITAPESSVKFIEGKIK